MGTRRHTGEVVAWALSLVPLLLWLVGGGLEGGTAGPRRGSSGSFGLLVAQAAGLVGMAMLAVSVVLAARLRWLEDYFGGLDGLYRAHHRLGITAVGLLVLHPVALALRFVPARPGKALALFGPGHGQWAVEVGVVAFWGLVLLIGVTYASWVPYDTWTWTHKALGLVLAAGAVHMWFVAGTPGRGVAVAAQPLLWGYMTAVVGAGLLAVVYKTILLPLRPGVPYTVAAVDRRSDDVMEVTLGPEGRPLDFVPGQFVFVTVHDDAVTSEAHPYTLCGPADAETLTITIKALGDYTRRLYERLAPGMAVSLEGPYGRFDYRMGGDRQIWVAGGVGVAPFLSWARNRAADGAAAPDVDFYYCVHDRTDAVYREELEALARTASWLDVVLVCSVEDGHLHADDIPALEGADVFLCGPHTLTRDLRRQLRRRGVPKARIHFEDFEFR